MAERTCPNGPDLETGEWPCEPDEDGSCVTCGWTPAVVAIRAALIDHDVVRYDRRAKEWVCDEACRRCGAEAALAELAPGPQAGVAHDQAEEEEGRGS